MPFQDLLTTQRTESAWPVAEEDLSHAQTMGYFRGNQTGKVQPRLRKAHSEGNPAFAAFIAPGEPTSGGYGGMSWVLFPTRSGRNLVGLVVGTRGIQPDEQILGAPGHARRCQAVAQWLRDNGDGTWAWAKSDPVRTDRGLPGVARRDLLDQAGDDEELRADLATVLDRYGEVIYAMSLPPAEAGEEVVWRGAMAWLYLAMEAREVSLNQLGRNQWATWTSAWTTYLLPETTQEQVRELLLEQRFVILEGPPGTGKTHLALKLRGSRAFPHGRSIQFHPSTTYERFIVGLAPTTSAADTGMRFEVRAGDLVQAVTEAARSDEPYLLHIDEINRGDLAKVLGEAIFLFERADLGRSIQLEHAPPGLAEALGVEEGTLRLPENLYVLGTMNTSDRSIALLDLAIRRRFAFRSVWPTLDGIELDQRLGRRLFQELVDLWISHAPDRAFHLLPGHAYFRHDDASLRRRLQTTLVPLLQTYMDQGMVAGFTDEVAAWLDRLQTQA